jgi:TPP-dependent pyruvate/acetoin dehydrogenase alpha subunit
MTVSSAAQTATAHNAAPGHAAPHLAAVPAPFMLISAERLWELYSAMLRCRAIAERAGELVRAGVPAKPLSRALGREAMYAGVLVGLQQSDVLLATPEDRLAEFLHGVSLGELFAPFAASKQARRKKTSSTKKASLPPPVPTPKAQLHMANGAALALKPQKGDPLAVALCGAGAAKDETWKQALAFAGAHMLPILFVCYAEARKTSGRAAIYARFDELHALAQAAQVPAIAVDAQDAVAVYRVTSESISRARLRRGPTVIACLAHPTLQAAERDEDAGSQTSASEAVRGMETYLDRKSLFDPARKARLMTAFMRQLDRTTRRLMR